MSSQTISILEIDDMACGGCADSVQQALKDIPGVAEAKANHEEGTALVRYDREQLSRDDFKQAVEDAGYSFEGIK